MAEADKLAGKVEDAKEDAEKEEIKDSKKESKFARFKEHMTDLNKSEILKGWKASKNARDATVRGAKIGAKKSWEATKGAGSAAWEASKWTAGKGWGATKVGAKVGAGAVSVGAAGVGGLGMLAGGAIGTLSSANMYFILGMLFHFFVDGINQFQTSPVVRFTFYLVMFFIGWVWIFSQGGPTRQGFAKSLGLNAIAFFIPYLLNIGGLPGIIGARNISIILAVLPAYLVYFFFIEPNMISPKWETVKKIYILIFILIFANWAYHAGSSQLALETLEFIPGLDGPVSADIFGVWADIINTVLETLKAIWAWIVDLLTNWSARIGGLFNSTIGANVYTGQTDVNAVQKLGVFLEPVKSTDKTYGLNEPVGVFSTLSANTLDRAIHANIQCEGDSGNKDADGKAIKVQADAIYPQKSYTFEEFSSEDIDCSFAADAFIKGTHRVEMKVDFDFETQAYFKSYFVDKERSRSFRRTGRNVLDVYKITDKKPIAIYTDGPVQVGIGIGKPQPIELDLQNDESNRLTLGITLRNKWDGEVNAFNKIAVMMPQQMDIQNRMCGTIEMKPGECSDMKVTCDPKLYRVYVVDLVQNKESFENIKGFKSLRCPITINSGSLLLGNSPVLTEFFRVHADYEYSLSRSTSITVKEVS
jgi:hypothetical protein